MAVAPPTLGAWEVLLVGPGLEVFRTMQNEEARRRGRGAWAWVIAGLSTILVVALVGGLFWVRPFHQKQEPAPYLPEPQQPQAQLHPPARGVTTFLLLGADKRPGDLGRADTMIIGSYDEEHERLAMVSIPRDTYTYVRGHDYTKINHAYAYGGVPLTRASAQQLIGLPIDHYVVVNFQGFMQFIDALGGVQIDAEKRMYYVDPEDTGMGPNGLVIDIQPGLQRMDGYDTLAYARFRKDAEGDHGRMRRQQQVIQAVAGELTQPSTFAKIPKLIPTLFGTIETDLTMAQMISYGLSGKGAMERGIVAATTTGEDIMLEEIAYVVPNIVDLRTTVYRTLMGEEPTAEYLAQAEADQAAYTQVLIEAEGLSQREGGP